MTLMIVPITVQDAREYVRQHHRHHRPPVSGLFAVACAADDEVCGVAIVGRPVARQLQDGWTAEVTRVATDGMSNACSKLYSACRRAALALGYRKLVTYTLQVEPGVSLRGADRLAVAVASEGNRWGTETTSWLCRRTPRKGTDDEV